MYSKMVLETLIGSELAFEYNGETRYLDLEKVEESKANKLTLRGLDVVKTGYRSFSVEKVENLRVR